jgi:hypothetical protein
MKLGRRQQAEPGSNTLPEKVGDLPRKRDVAAPRQKAQHKARCAKTWYNGVKTLKSRRHGSERLDPCVAPRKRR